MTTLGIIAGAGAFPAHAAQNAHAMGRRVVVAILAEAGGSVSARRVDAVETHAIARSGGILEFFQREGVDEVLFVGKVDKRLNFATLEFDEVALAMIARLAGRGDMQIAQVVIEELETRGFRVCPQVDYLGDLIAAEGELAGRLNREAHGADVAKGLEIARLLADRDIGQTVVMRSGAVVAVEAFEHTDAAIRRAGRLAHGDLVVVKVARPKQDPRFDVPAVGPRTIKAMSAAGARVLAVEAGRTFLIDRDRMLRQAEELGICVLGVCGRPLWMG